ncbi:MAG TPA: hypothetical protein VLC79_09055, partial [Cellvibrio sp.]|nr:hypothetical protein [Cellvibrio sp.]
SARRVGVLWGAMGAVTVNAMHHLLIGCPEQIALNAIHNQKILTTRPIPQGQAAKLLQCF